MATDAEILYARACLLKWGDWLIAAGFIQEPRVEEFRVALDNYRNGYGFVADRRYEPEQDPKLDELFQ